MSHPFWWLPDHRWPVLAALLVVTLVFAVVLRRQGRPLDQAGASIVDYELAWSRAGAQAVLDGWQALVSTARKQILIDFGFLLVYPPLLALACAMLSESPRNELAAVGLFLSWAVLAAAPLDAVENLALLSMLDRGAADAPARLAGWCAGLKFTLVFAGLGYAVLQGLAVGIARLRGG